MAITGGAKAVGTVPLSREDLKVGPVTGETHVRILRGIETTRRTRSQWRSRGGDPTQTRLATAPSPDCPADRADRRGRFAAQPANPRRRRIAPAPIGRRAPDRPNGQPAVPVVNRTADRRPPGAAVDEGNR